MKRWLWPDSLRGRLIILALVCLISFQAVNTATLFVVQYQQRVYRLTLLASQTAEWYTLLNGRKAEEQEAALETLKELYNNAAWRLEFALLDQFPDAQFSLGTEGPILRTREFFAEALSFRGEPVPPMLAGFSRSGDRQGLQIAVQLDDGRWFAVTRLRAATLRQEKLQHGVFLAEFLAFFLIMFCLLYRETRQLERLRQGVERFGDSPESAEQLPEEGCREIRETAQSLNRMRGRVLSSIEERDRMLSALRHDLRTPLTRLQLWAEEAEPEEVRGRLLENGRQIQDMVTQSIELAGSLTTTEEQVVLDVTAFVESMADDYAEEGRKVSFIGEAEQNFILRTRPTCLRRCLSNLIENALKYAGSAEVALFQREGLLCIEVRDSGPGIPPDMLDKVLEPWFRVENSRNRETGGSGLGLAIAKNMARLSGARLSLHDRESGGLCARICFQS
jgi:signal transduction histidine kinase